MNGTFEGAEFDDLFHCEMIAVFEGGCMLSAVDISASVASLVTVPFATSVDRAMSFSWTCFLRRRRYVSFFATRLLLVLIIRCAFEIVFPESHSYAG